MALNAKTAYQDELPLISLVRKRGRPSGSKAKLTQSQLRVHHFSYVRALMQGIAPRKAWQLYLAHEGGPDDDRHFSACLRRLQQQILSAANERGLGAVASIALSDHSISVVNGALSTSALPVSYAPASPAIPSLEDWVAERCSGSEIDEDFYSHAEWVELYEDEFELNQVQGKVTASSIPDLGLSASTTGEQNNLQSSARTSLNERLTALNHLAMDLAVPPTLNDNLSAWLSSDLSQRLSCAVVDGKTIPLLTIDSLITFVNQFHFRWWTKIPRLGKERADRMLAWLKPIAETLGKPLIDIATRPLHQHLLAQRRTLETLNTSSGKRYAIVPLDRLAVPAELDGSAGAFRGRSQSLFRVNTDLEAIQSWLQLHQHSPRTFATYRRIVERFYLWCVLIKKMPLSSLTEGSFHEYRVFMEEPPSDWIQARRTGRETDEWRPFKGPVDQKNLKLNFTVISALFTALQKGGYLSPHAPARGLSHLRLPDRSTNITRTFDNAQWGWILKYWASLYAIYGPEARNNEEQLTFPSDENPDRSFVRASSLRRTRLILELGATTGISLIELVTTRRSSLLQRSLEGESYWILRVQGKSREPREVLVYNDVKVLLDQHHADMTRAKTHFDPSIDRQRQQRNQLTTGNTPLAQPGTSLNSHLPTKPETDNLPLIGALRRPPPRWGVDGTGTPTLDTKPSKNADRYGSLDPTALHQSLKRFLTECCNAQEPLSKGINVEQLRNASTHWLRHFFAQNAIESNINLDALMTLMGHASLQSTSVYLDIDRSQSLKDMTRIKRRL